MDRQSRLHHLPRRRSASVLLVLTLAASLGGALAIGGSPAAEASTSPVSVVKAADAAEVPCSSESGRRSVKGDTKATIDFVNQTTATVKVYWLNYQGQRVFYRSVSAGQRYPQPTFVTHPWVVTDTNDSCLAIFLPAAGSTTARITSAVVPSVSPGTTSSPSPSRTTASPSPGDGSPPVGSGSGGGSSTVEPGSIATSLPTPSDAFSSLARAAISAAIVLAAILLITFPAELFNRTFEEHYDDIRAWWERRIPWASRARERRASGDGERGALGFVAVAVVGGLLGTLLDPHAGLNGSTVAMFLSIVLAFLVGAAIWMGAALAYRRARGFERTAHLKALPAGLAVAAVCVLLSRLSDFQPGYLYGLIGGLAFSRELGKAEEGRVVALSSLAVLGLGVVAWLVWVPVHTSAAEPGAGFGSVLLDDFLAAAFVGGLVGLVIRLLPLRFLPGGQLAAWSRPVWAGTFGLALFGLVHLMLRTQAGPHPGAAPLVTIIVLFVAFGGGSIAFHRFFARRSSSASAIG